MIDKSKIDDSVFNLSTLKNWHGKRISMDGADTSDFTKEDVDYVEFFYGDGDTWDGKEVCLFVLKDGRIIGYENFYGPTGDGFHEDAYGGDTDVIFAKSLGSLKKEIAHFQDEGKDGD